jgi:hypothetical protein
MTIPTQRRPRASLGARTTPAGAVTLVQRRRLEYNRPFCGRDPRSAATQIRSLEVR